jgi:hypothetical protein
VASVAGEVASLVSAHAGQVDLQRAEPAGASGVGGGGCMGGRRGQQRAAKHHGTSLLLLYNTSWCKFWQVRSTLSCQPHKC